MLLFDRLTKRNDRPTNDLPLMKADDRHPDGRFKTGPVNTQHKRADNAMDMAHGHLDDAATAARQGDEDQARFHLDMAQTYAQAACQNHLLGGYLKGVQDGGKAAAAGDKK